MLSHRVSPKSVCVITGIINVHGILVIFAGISSQDDIERHKIKIIEFENGFSYYWTHTVKMSN